MRLFSKYIPQKNPTNRRALNGEKKKLHSSVLRALNAPRKNPSSLEDDLEFARERMRRRDPSAVDAFNLLGELNLLIESGFSQYIPLRDVVVADIEGYLSKDQAHLQLEEAIRDLRKKDIDVLSEQLKRAKYAEPAVGLSKGRVLAIKRKHDMKSDVIEARKRARVLQSKRDELHRRFEEWLRRSKISDTAFIVGPERLESMKKLNRAAREELGSELGSYIPADPKLFKKVETALENKIGGRYVPPTIGSVRKDESEALALIGVLKESEAKAPSAAEKSKIRDQREKLEARLARAVAARWRTRLILEYERLGGKEFIGSKRRKVKFEEIDQPFDVGDGLYGVVSNEGADKYRWRLLDSGGKVYISGISPDTRIASRQINISKRVLVDLVTLGQSKDKEGGTLAGWDNIEDRNRRWLETNKPDLSPSVARMLLNEIGQTHKPDRATAIWLVKSSKLDDKALQKEGIVVRKSSGVKGMVTGETREFPGRNKMYNISVEKTMDGYRSTVKSRSGTSKKFFTKTQSEVLPKAHVLGGLMMGAEQVGEAISNPGKLRRMHSNASKNLEKRAGRRKNPDVPRIKAGTADIKSLAGLYAIPDDSEEAFKLGLYFGIMRGIDTCGVQNYFERKRIRKKFAEQLMRGAFETAAVAGGTAPPKAKRSRSKSGGISSLMSDLDFSIEDE